MPGVYGRFCSGPEVWAGWAVNHLNWFQLPPATLESPAWLRTADYWFPHCIVIWLLTQLYCSELQPPGDWQGAMFQCSLMLHNVHSRSDPYFNKTQYLRLRLYDSDFNALIALWSFSDFFLTWKYEGWLLKTDLDRTDGETLAFLELLSKPK